MDLREERTTLASGLDVAYLAAGNDGPLAICLHGFPDTAHTWRHLLPALADAGYRAVAPWLRGYAPTGVPADGLYQNGALVRDAVELHAALGGGADAVVIGHDWGARAANGAAGFAPDSFRKVVTMAVPPAGAVAEGFFSFRQLKRSWYMFFFQHPLADIAVGMDDLDFIDRLWEEWSPGYTASADDRAWVKESLAAPANLAAALGYYRATLQFDLQVPELAAEEAAVGMDDLDFIDRLWEEWSPGYTASADDRAWVKESLAAPANLAAALGYYRATLQFDLQVPELAAEEAAVGAVPPQPHLYLHGVDDGCMGVELAERAGEFLTAEGSRVELVPGTGHFLHLEAPDAVNTLIVDFLAEPDPA